MDCKKSLLFSFFLFSFSSAFNITEILGVFKDYSTFNDLLTKTQLAGDINSRQTITVLVVPNSALSALSGKPMDVVKKILSVHVVLDYYDMAKLQKVNTSATLTTLFQSSGHATGQQGFLTVNLTTSGGVVLSSQASGSTPGANVVKAVLLQPPTVSVLQINAVIVPTGIDATSNSSGSPSPAPHLPVPAPGPAISPEMSPPSRSPVQAPTMAPHQAPGGAPGPSHGGAPGPSHGGAGDPAATPGTPPEPDNSVPSGQAPESGDADTEKPKSKSAGVAYRLSTSGVFIIIASLVSSFVSIV